MISNAKSRAGTRLIPHLTDSFAKLSEQKNTIISHSAKSIQPASTPRGQMQKSPRGHSPPIMSLTLSTRCKHFDHGKAYSSKPHVDPQLFLTTSQPSTADPKLTCILSSLRLSQTARTIPWIQTPLAARRLHQPVVLAVLGSVAHDQHAVVQLGAAGLAEHSALVELEGHLICLLSQRHSKHRKQGSTTR